MNRSLVGESLELHETFGLSDGAVVPTSRERGHREQVDNQGLRCRSCGAGRADIHLVLDLGRTPLANRLLRTDQLDEPEPTYPLRLVFCSRCTLLQIDETVAPEVLFRDYVYFSSFSETMVRHAGDIAERMIVERHLNGNSLVVEAASNDGYLLQHFVRHGVPVLGIEPARNVAAVAQERGIRTVSEFFDARLAAQLRSDGQAADVFFANNVFAHVADLGDFVRGVRTILAPHGRALFEVPYAKQMLDNVEFDTIYHEHLCYFSLTSLHYLFRNHRLQIEAVEQLPIHGGTLPLVVGHESSVTLTASVKNLLAEEQRWGVDRIGSYVDFARRVDQLKSSLCGLLANLKQQGKRIVAYGAAAKGSTLLNYIGIGAPVLDFVVDRSTHKQGKLMPGVHLPIYGPERLLEGFPDFVLLLTWNFADEILRQQAEYRSRGGKFIIPLPQPEIV